MIPRNDSQTTAQAAMGQRGGTALPDRLTSPGAWREIITDGADLAPIEGFALEQLIDHQRAMRSGPGHNT
ncbi:hypothetical protein [Loktanella sp. 3ANDIMAR09]|uniref:hypothetical protein n=1 Tax=Loktanella sp. 3ANDIMAR09 TaxID=1225657 RepID=UPI000AB3423E|nr:hypothetical protein [Loktanella sp. 3ANDIMAR09]